MGPDRRRKTHYLNSISNMDGLDFWGNDTSPASEKNVWLSYNDEKYDRSTIEELVDFLENVSTHSFRCFFAARDLLPSWTYFKFVDEVLKSCLSCVVGLSEEYLGNKQCMMDVNHILNDTTVRTIVWARISRFDTALIPLRLIDNSMPARGDRWFFTAVESLLCGRKIDFNKVDVLDKEFNTQSQEKINDKRFWFREKRIYIENGKSGIVHLPNVACHYEAAAVEEDIVAPEKHVVSIKVADYPDDIKEHVAKERCPLSTALMTVGHIISINANTAFIGEALKLTITSQNSELQKGTKVVILYSQSCPFGGEWSDVTRKVMTGQDLGTDHSIIQFVPDEEGVFLICSVETHELSQHSLYTLLDYTNTLSRFCSTHYAALRIGWKHVPMRKDMILYQLAAIGGNQQPSEDLNKDDSLMIYIPCTSSALTLTISIISLTRPILKMPVSLPIGASALQLPVLATNSWEVQVLCFSDNDRKEIIAVNRSVVPSSSSTSSGLSLNLDEGYRLPDGSEGCDEKTLYAATPSTANSSEMTDEKRAMLKKQADELLSSPETGSVGDGHASDQFSNAADADLSDNIPRSLHRDSLVLLQEVENRIDERQDDKARSGEKWKDNDTSPPGSDRTSRKKQEKVDISHFYL